MPSPTRAFGRTQGFISKIESGEIRIDPIELLRFAELYGVEVTVLLPGAERPHGGGALGGETSEFAKDFGRSPALRKCGAHLGKERLLERSPCEALSVFAERQSVEVGRIADEIEEELARIADEIEARGRYARPLSARL